MPRQYRVFPTRVNTSDMNSLLLCAACVNKQLWVISTGKPSMSRSISHNCRTAPQQVTVRDTVQKSASHVGTHTHTQTVKYLTVCITVSYLLDAISPALADTVTCPDVVCILSQFVHHGFLGGSQFDVTQVQRSRFITTRQLIAAQIELNH